MASSLAHVTAPAPLRAPRPVRPVSASASDSALPLLLHRQQKLQNPFTAQQHRTTISAGGHRQPCPTHPLHPTPPPPFTTASESSSGEALDEPAISTSNSGDDMAIDTSMPMNPGRSRRINAGNEESPGEKRARLTQVAPKPGRAVYNADLVDAHNELYSILRSFSVPPEETNAALLSSATMDLDRTMATFSPPTRQFNTLPQRRPSIGIALPIQLSTGMTASIAPALAPAPAPVPVPAVSVVEATLPNAATTTTQWNQTMSPLSSTPPSAMLAQLMRYASTLTPEEYAAVRSRRPSVPSLLSAPASRAASDYLSSSAS